MAAHLAEQLARTQRPVIGVPVDSGPLQGFDALLSTAQMPGGVPVATVAVGKAGAKNAGYLAGQILAASDQALHEKIVADRAKGMLKRLPLRIVGSKIPFKGAEITQDLDKTTQIIRAGGVVAHATEGVGALACRPDRHSASKDPENQRSR